MAKLPGPEDVGPAPETLPRRQGVGSWNPQVITGDAGKLEQGAQANEQGASRMAQGAESLARGATDYQRGSEQFSAGMNNESRGTAAVGDALATVGHDVNQSIDQWVEKDNEYQLAKASTDYTVKQLQTNEQLNNSTNPDDLPDIANNYKSNFKDTQSSLPGYLQPAFANRNMPTLTEAAVNVDKKGKELNQQQTISDFHDKANYTVNQSAQVDDDRASQQPLTALGNEVEAMKQRGLITPEQAQQYRQDYTGQWVLARQRYLTADAKNTGNTSRLEQFQGALNGNNQPQGSSPGTYGQPVPPLPVYSEPQVQQARQVLNSVSRNSARPGDTSNLHPAFAVELAAAIQDAKSQGLNVGVESGFRKPTQLLENGDTSNNAQYDAAGNSAHSYGIAADISGLGEPGSAAAQQWAKIAQAHGLSNPYDQSGSEFNHWQMLPTPLEKNPQLLSTLKAAAQTGDMQKVWAAVAPANVVGGAGPVNMSIPPEGRALLASIYSGESGGRYNVRYGGNSGPKTFNDLSQHPNVAEQIPGSLQVSTAAGAGQMISTTWREQAAALGLKDFSPANQDAANWNLAKQRYGQTTGGRDLLADLKSGDPTILANIAPALKATWTSLDPKALPSDKFVSGLQLNIANQVPKGMASGIHAPSGSEFRGLPAPSAPVMATQMGSEGGPAPQGAVAAGAPVAQGAAAVQPGASGSTALPGNQVAGPGAPSNLGATGAASTLAPSVVPGMPPGTPPPVSVATQLTPPEDAWPKGTAYVAHNKAGQLVYVQQGTGVQTPVPGSAPTGQSGLPLPNRPSGSPLDFLHPAAHAEANLQVQDAIDSINRQKASQFKQDATTVDAYMKGRVKELVSGQNIPDENWKNVMDQYGGSPNPAIQEIIGNADAVRTQLKAYNGLTLPQVAQSVANLESEYQKGLTASPTDQTNVQRKTVLESAQAYLAKYQKDANSNMLMRGIQQGILPGGTPPVNPQDPHLGDNINQRVNDALNVAGQFGVKPQFLLPAEKQNLKQIENQGGQPMTDLLKAVVENAGPHAQQILGEIGGAAPKMAGLGRSIAMGANEDTVAALAEYTRAENDPQAKGDLPKVSAGFFRSGNIKNPFGTALNGLGADQAGSLNEQSNRLMSYNAWKAGIDPSTDGGKVDPAMSQAEFNKAASAVVGGHVDQDGTRWGGILNRGEHNWTGTTQPTLIPNNIKTDQFETVLGKINDGDLARMTLRPLWHGETLSADDLQRAQLSAVPSPKTGTFDGQYGVTLDGKEVYDQRGKPWKLDLGAMEPLLRSRAKDSYTPMTIAPAAPLNPYNNNTVVASKPAPHYSSATGISFTEPAEAAEAGDNQLPKE